MTFTDVSTNPKNDPVMAVGRTNGSYSPYNLVDTTLVADSGYVQTHSATAAKSVVDVAVDDDGNTFLYDDYYQATFKRPAGTSPWRTSPALPMTTE